MMCVYVVLAGNFSVCVRVRENYAKCLFIYVCFEVPLCALYRVLMMMMVMVMLVEVNALPAVKLIL